MRVLYKIITIPAVLAVFASYPSVLKAEAEQASLLQDASVTIDAAKLAGLKPHKAQNAISMASKKSASQVQNVAGRMNYEWRSDCFAWISDHSLDVIYDYTDGTAVRVESAFSTYETMDGMEMNFSTEKKRNGMAFQKVRGYADLETREAHYSIPEGVRLELPEKTLFPMSHTLQVLKHMKEGERFFASTIFDGSDEEGPIFVNAFMGPRVKVDEEILKNTDLDQSFLKSPARHVRLSFYKDDGEYGLLPDYEMSLNLHENGVISAMHVEYEDFSVEQTLIGLAAQDKTCTEELNGSQ